jgi:DNA-directed RNA polymerase sigma subunit (sigma70/sigma32)
MKISYSFHLNNYQIKTINNLIKNPETKLNEREIINKILYKSYEKWAVKKAIDFKKIHKFKCKNINNEELFLSSKIGLFKSIQKYNGKYNFINYSIFYINSELLKLLTDKYSLCNIPKKERMKNKVNVPQIDLFKYNNLLNIKLSHDYDVKHLELIFKKEDDILGKIHKKYVEKEKMNILLNNITLFEKRIIYLKYNLYSNKVISNKKIAELMCCSEETIRNKLILIKNTLINN